MKARLIRSLATQEDLNFLLTNRVPRHLLTRLAGWYSRIDNPWLTRASIAIWRLFTDLDLSDAEPRRYRSVHECFTRRLQAGARPLDPRPDVLTSPCDAIVGAHGEVNDGMVFQAKGYPYRLDELIPDHDIARSFGGGSFVTLRLTSAMYHHFHAPCDMHLTRVIHVAGDTWNVNPIALRRIERLFCRNERAVISASLGDGRPLVMVPVAAILVASLRLTFANLHLHHDYRGPRRILCDAHATKGDELGWFEHGSTIVMLVPPGFVLSDDLADGVPVRMGEALFEPIRS